MKEAITITRSPEGRCLSSIYPKGASRAFSLFERTGEGVLATEFRETGEVLNMSYYHTGEIHEVIKKALGSSNQIEDVPEYAGIKLKAPCTACSAGPILRELDLVPPGSISKPPVIPLFRCTNCGKRYYAISNEYLECLAEGNRELFDKADLEEMSRDKATFINTLNEYVIRIFASKKISRMSFKT